MSPVSMAPVAKDPSTTVYVSGGNTYTSIVTPALSTPYSSLATSLFVSDGVTHTSVVTLTSSLMVKSSSTRKIVAKSCLIFTIAVAIFGVSGVL